MTFIINQPVKTLVYASLGLFIRLALITIYKEPIRQRNEVTTPIGSWKRAYEAVHLWDSGLDPYSGNIFHEYPISLQIYKILISYFNVDLAFAVTDVITALFLQHSVYNQLIISNQSKEVSLKRSMRVLMIYLFSPINISTCAGMSTSIFTNFLVAVISFILPMKPFRALTCVLSAFLICNNIHFTALALPIFLCLEHCSNSKKQQKSKNTDDKTTDIYYLNPDFSRSLTTSATICLVTILTLTFTSYLLMGNSWTFIQSSYLFALKIQDLTPNIGMFWYFFTEMFDQFLDFFTWVVQINAFIHVVPLSIYFKDDPFFALYMMIVTSSIFQPYLSLSHIGLITSLLPQWSELFPYMRRSLIVFCASATCISLWPVFWHLWIMMGTANSNFYFGATLAFTLSIIILMIDLFESHRLVRAKLRLSNITNETPQTR